MPYKERGLTMFRDWEPDGNNFDPEVDRLLVTTSWHDTFVARQGGDEGDDFDFVVDPQFMPINLAAIPGELTAYRKLPFRWDAAQYPWGIFLCDGEMTHSGPFIVMEAAGVGWTRPVVCDVTVISIKPVRVQDIIRRRLCTTLRGIHLGEFTLNEDAMIDLQTDEFERSLQS